MISVIVPAYNACKYIRKCIQSIINQEYDDFELLLIDDGSTDGTPEICDEYARLDNRVFSIHNTHKGLVAARRYGINMAKGDYICWIDSDDWVERSFLSDFYRFQHNNNVDAVVTGLFYDIGDYTRKETNSILPGKYEVGSILDKAFYSGGFFRYGIIPNLVAKFFKTEILHKAIKLVDDAITIGEDAAISYIALGLCEKIYISDVANYHYVHHKDSMTMHTSLNETEKIGLLIACLRQNLMGTIHGFDNAIKIYERFLLFSRTDNLLKEKNGKVLLPYGGLLKGENVIIYGAGGTGQVIHKFITETNSLNILAWVDGEFNKYKMEGFPVMPPSCIRDILHQSSAKIIVAVSYDNVANQIINYLLSQHISRDLIVWLSEEFIHGEEY